MADPYLTTAVEKPLEVPRRKFFTSDETALARLKQFDIERGLQRDRELMRSAGRSEEEIRLLQGAGVQQPLEAARYNVMSIKGAEPYASTAGEAGVKQQIAANQAQAAQSRNIESEAVTEHPLVPSRTTARVGTELAKYGADTAAFGVQQAGSEGIKPFARSIAENTAKVSDVIGKWRSLNAGALAKGALSVEQKKVDADLAELDAKIKVAPSQAAREVAVNEWTTKNPTSATILNGILKQPYLLVQPQEIPAVWQKIQEAMEGKFPSTATQGQGGGAGGAPNPVPGQGPPLINVPIPTRRP